VDDPCDKPLVLGSIVEKRKVIEVSGWKVLRWRIRSNLDIRYVNCWRYTLSSWDGPWAISCRWLQKYPSSCFQYLWPRRVTDVNTPRWFGPDWLFSWDEMQRISILGLFSDLMIAFSVSLLLRIAAVWLSSLSVFPAPSSRRRIFMSERMWYQYQIVAYNAWNLNRCFVPWNWMRWQKSAREEDVLDFGSFALHCVVAGLRGEEVWIEVVIGGILNDLTVISWRLAVLLGQSAEPPLNHNLNESWMATTSHVDEHW